MRRLGTTLARHINDEEHRIHGATGELSRLINQIAYVAKVLQAEVGRAALDNELGYTGTTNETGDSQKKLDVFSNKIVVEAFAETKLVAGIISEEMDEMRVLSTGANARYVLTTDPIDGSSNTDINGVVGTIFSIYRLPQANAKAKIEDEVLSGRAEHTAAGYVMYGTSTLLVYSTGKTVNGFTLDRSVGEFLLSHPNIRCPQKGNIYSANLGNYEEWTEGVRKYVQFAQSVDAASGRPYSLRYTGSLTADLHRSLIEGGIYFYPADKKHPGGKLRMMYECRPLAFVVEAAGGRASDGETRILELPMKEIHEQVPFAIGSAENMAEYERFVAGGR